MPLHTLLNQPINAFELARFAEVELLEGRRLYRPGVAAFVLNEEGELLVCEHPESMGEYESGSMGTVSEKLRYVPARGLGMTETPYEGWQRGLFEELTTDDAKFSKAGFYTDTVQPDSFDRVVINTDAQGVSSYYWTATFITFVRNPGVLEYDTRPSDEVLRSYFMPIDEILASEAPKRPGYQEWVQKMSRHVSTLGRLGAPVELEWQDLPVTGDDVSFPLTEAR